MKQELNFEKKEGLAFFGSKEELENIRIQVTNKKNNWSQIATSSLEKDSYNLIVNIIKRAESKILIIDNYIKRKLSFFLTKV